MKWDKINQNRLMRIRGTEDVSGPDPISFNPLPAYKPKRPLSHKAIEKGLRRALLTGRVPDSFVKFAVDLLRKSEKGRLFSDKQYVWALRFIRGEVRERSQSA